MNRFRFIDKFRVLFDHKVCWNRQSGNCTQEFKRTAIIQGDPEQTFVFKKINSSIF